MSHQPELICSQEVAYDRSNRKAHRSRSTSDRRSLAFRMNENGWTGQIKNIESYLAQSE
jgi:hypothetical protein